MALPARRPPLHIVRLPEDAPGTPRQVLVDALLAVTARVNTIDEDVLQVHIVALRLVGAHDDLTRSVEELDIDVREVLVEIRELSTAVKTAIPVPPSLPPMRARSTSTLDLVESLTAEAERDFRKRADETPGPGVGDPPEALAERFKTMLEAAFAEREARDQAHADAVDLERLRSEEEARFENARRTAAKTKADAEQKVIDDEKDSKQRKKDFRNGLIKWVGVVTSGLTVLFIAWLAAQAYAEHRHDVGVAEESARGHVPVLVAVTPEVASAMATAAVISLPASALAAPPSSPASAAPRHHP